MEGTNTAENQDALSDSAFEGFLKRLRSVAYQLFVTMYGESGTYIVEDYVLANTDEEAKTNGLLLLEKYCERGSPAAWVLYAPDGHLVEM